MFAGLNDGTRAGGRWTLGITSGEVPHEPPFGADDRDLNFRCAGVNHLCRGAHAHASLVSSCDTD